MAAVSPFCALRYDTKLIGDLSRVIAPPYDVIDVHEQDQLYQSSPHNIVRLILGKQYETDTERENRYSRAQRDFETWHAQGVLRQDPTPALYLVEHTFLDGGRPRARVGFIALLTFDEGMERAVLRHEATLEAPKADRAKLLDAVPANLSPIFCIYPDPHGAIHARLQRVSQHNPPTIHATLNGEAIRLWLMTEPETIQDIVRALSSVSVLIADGHHRFEVAYSHRHRYGAVMSYFVSMEEPSLLVKPIHRMIQAERPMDHDALRRIGLVERAQDLATFQRWLEAGTGQGRFGYADGQGLYQLTIHPEVLARWLMAKAVPLPVASLDVSILHGFVLPTLGLPITWLGHDGPEARAQVSFTAEASEALETVTREHASSAWLLRGIPVSQVYALASQGFALPPKSTYFYPKVPSGLTINLLG